MRLMIIVTVLLCCLLPIATWAELPLDALALYMSFDDIQGNKVGDGSENGNDGTIMKASVAKDKGKYGNAMEFKGGDNHLIFGLEAHFFRCGRKARSCIFFLTKRFKNVRIIVSLGGD